MLKSTKVLAVAALVLCVSVFAFTQEGEGGFDFGLNIGIGATTIDNKPYSMLSLSPDIAIGKFGIGLELILHYTVDEVRREDWVPTGSATFLDVYLPKFKYIRYGFKGDPLYAKFGSIEYALLGNGFIMGGYDNTMFLPQEPDRRVFGLSFDLDGALFNFPYIGIETFVGNLSQYDVMGFRPFIRPLAFTEIPVIRNLQVGGTVAFDRKPGLYDKDSIPPATGNEDPVVVYGGDITLPILSSPVFSLTTFADIAFLKNTLGSGNRGKGEMVGFGGRLLGVINYGAQIRLLGEDFIPTYFDTGYDLYRFVKYDAVQAANIEPYVGWLGSLGFTFFDDALVFNATLDGPVDAPGASNYLDWPHLYAIFILGEGIIPNLSLEASWDKRSIGSQDGFFRDLTANFKDDSIFGARVNYAIGAAVLSFVYQGSYNRTTDEWETKSGIESAIQLF